MLEGRIVSFNEELKERRARQRHERLKQLVSFNEELKDVNNLAQVVNKNPGIL